jgi:hypothetical protein
MRHFRVGYPEHRTYARYLQDSTGLTSSQDSPALERAVVRQLRNEEVVGTIIPPKRPSTPSCCATLAMVSTLFHRLKRHRQEVEGGAVVALPRRVTLAMTADTLTI